MKKFFKEFWPLMMFICIIILFLVVLGVCCAPRYKTEKVDVVAKGKHTLVIWGNNDVQYRVPDKEVYDKLEAGKSVMVKIKYAWAGPLAFENEIIGIDE